MGERKLIPLGIHVTRHPQHGLAVLLTQDALIEMAMAIHSHIEEEGAKELLPVLELLVGMMKQLAKAQQMEIVENEGGIVQ